MLTVERHDVVLAHDVVWYQLDGVGINRKLAQIHHRDAEFFCQRAFDHVLVDDPHIDQNFTQRHFAILLLHG